MIIVVVNFPLPETMSATEYRARIKETVPRFAAMPGLRRKNYLSDGARRLGGGVYTFDSRANAQACFSEDFVKRVTAAYGPPDIRYFETPILIDADAGDVPETALSA